MFLLLLCVFEGVGRQEETATGVPLLFGYLEKGVGAGSMAGILARAAVAQVEPPTTMWSLGTAITTANTAAGLPLDCRPCDRAWSRQAPQ